MTRTQILGTGLLGIWIGWTLFMWLAATRSFRTVDRVLQSPRAQLEETVKRLGHDQTRVAFRYLASEINRSMFSAYCWSQVLLGLLLFILLRQQTPRDTITLALAGLMVILVLILTIIVQPLMVSLGRNIDFAPRNPPPPEMLRFWMLHGAFTGLDVIKLLAGLGLLVRCILK